MVQQFAVASVSPRSIAWLIKNDEWDRLEEVIQYNSAMLGGYYNVIIPLTEQNTISETYQRFLFEYDPDIIVLTPAESLVLPDALQSRLCPFALVPWKFVTDIASLDPWIEDSGKNVALGQGIIKELKDAHFYVAVADHTKPDISRFAFIACGDIKPSTLSLNPTDKEIKLYASGHREVLLRKVLKPEYERHEVGMHFTSLENFQVVSPPSRARLAHLIVDEHQFPLSGAVAILSTCCRMQHEQKSLLSFINLTTLYKKNIERFQHSKQLPAIVVLVSDQFGIEEATLFWNLRASEFYVAWLPFLELERDAENITRWIDVNWLDGYPGGAFYTMQTGSYSLAFSSADGDIHRLQSIIATLQPTLQGGPSLSIMSRDELIVYDYLRPSARMEHISIAQNGPTCTAISPLPQEDRSGQWAMALDWKGLMLPPHAAVRDLVSSKVTQTFPILDYIGRRASSIRQIIPVTKLRISQNRYLRTQINTAELITFNAPSFEHIIGALFSSAGFSRVEASSAARYHRNFVDRAGSLEIAARYLSTSPYQELLEILSDNSDEEKKGWIVKAPDPRRTLHHLQLLDVLKKSIIPNGTREYFNTISDELPTEAIQLLLRQILERGFLLPCQSCSFRSWYPAEHVGQSFKCPRCSYVQVCISNPLWLYKLSEVIFQGFKDNMQVPLLALNYLRQGSAFYFDWLPDSNIYSSENVHRNVDILCSVNGRIYIGEAKSNNKIEKDQFSFYEDISRRVVIDSLVFATTQSEWSSGTLDRIEQLKTHFVGEVLILTAKELYPASI